MLNNLTFAAILIITFTSCGSNKKKAFNYSEDFVKKEKSLAADVTITEANVQLYLAAEKYDSIAIAGEKMEQLVEAKIQEIKKEPAPDVKEAENFKEACVSYFTFVKKMYTSYKQFGRAKTDTERELEREKLIELTEKKRSTINAVKAAQQKFADANKFRLE